MRSPGALQAVNAPSLPFRLVDAAVVLALAAAVVLSPWHYDEGWVDLTILNARTTGIYSYVIENNDAPYTFIKPWFALLNLFCFPSLGPGHVYLMRIPGLALALIGWAALVAALRFLGLRSLLARAAAGFVWAITGAEFLVNLRPEAGYVVPLAIALMLSLEWVRAARRSIVLTGLALASISVGVHPCGLLVPLVLVTAAPFGRPGFAWRDARWIVPATMAAAGMAAMMILWDQSPRAFFESSKAAANSDHTLILGEEWVRYVRLILHNPAEGSAYLIGFLTLPVLLLSTRIAGRVRAVLAAQVLVVGLFLLINPAKWHYYLSAYAPWLSISLACAAEGLTRKMDRFPALPNALVVVLAYFLIGTAKGHYAAVLDPAEASLFRVGVLERVFGVPANDQEKLIDTIPDMVGSHRVLAELYMFPMLNLLSLNKAHFEGPAPPEFLITGPPEFLGAGNWNGEPSATVWSQWPEARWIPVLRFRFEGRLVVVANPAPQ